MANLNLTGIKSTDGSDRTTTDFRYTSMSTAASTQLLTSSGMVHTVVVGAGIAAATLTLYDNSASASGSVVAVLGAATTGTYLLDANVNNGLNVLSSSAVNATITYK